MSLHTLRRVMMLAGFVLVIACLYWAQAVLIPTALAILLSALLSPVVGAVQRTGLRRIPSVIVTVVLAFSLLGGMGWVLKHQITNLADELPRYRSNIQQKIASLRQAQKGTVLEKVQTTAKEVVDQLQKEDPAAGVAEKPLQVVLVPPALTSSVPSLLEALATAGLVLSLVIFMLIRREELRNRLIRLIGYGRLTITTKALDEAGYRISRYLLMQSSVNASFGLAVTVGLFFIGVPYAALWGFLAAVLRFIPYVGAWIAAIFPSALALAVFDGWVQPLLVIGLFAILEPLIYLVLEPVLYGQSTGVSEVALLVALAFWTWLWGPVGLMLATPLTVCLVVLGKYVPEIEFIPLLMSDEPAMAPHINYYQRLLARDQDEAADVADEYLKGHPSEQLYDEVLVPALVYAKRDRVRQHLTPEEEAVIFKTTRQIVEDIGNRQPPRSTPAADPPDAVGQGPPDTALPRGLILGCPARDEADEAALLMLGQLVDPKRGEIEMASSTLLLSEVVALVEEKGSVLVCIGALAPGGLAQTRYLSKRLRTRFPELKILVGRWGDPEGAKESEPTLRAAGADEVGSTLLETRDQILALLPSLPRPELLEAVQPIHEPAAS